MRKRLMNAVLGFGFQRTKFGLEQKWQPEKMNNCADAGKCFCEKCSHGLCPGGHCNFHWSGCHKDCTK